MSGPSSSSIDYSLGASGSKNTRGGGDVTAAASTIYFDGADWSHRPALVRDSLREKKPIYYFGLGSNMSRSYLESRSFDGKKIEVLSMEPALVRGHRLAFNLPAYLPLEPAMGSLERYVGDESDGASKNEEKTDEKDSDFSLPLYPYAKNECHGALIRLSADDYERVMITEGVTGARFPARNYHEVVVTVVPYDASKDPVQAAVLRVRPHVRLPRDVAPSERYMQILRDGARELGLARCYQDFLNSHPVHVVPGWLVVVSLPNFIWTMQLYFTGTPLARKITTLQYRLMYLASVRPTSSAPKRWAGYACQGLILLPGAALGLAVMAYRRVTGTAHPVPAQMLLKRLWDNRRRK
jgi:hypothetical protein